MCRVLLCPLLLHLTMCAVLARRQYRRYYNNRAKQDKERRLQVQDPTQGGTDILF